MRRALQSIVERPARAASRSRAGQVRRCLVNWLNASRPLPDQARPAGCPTPRSSSQRRPR